MGNVIPIEAGQETPEQMAAEREAGELPDGVDPCTDLANAHRLAKLHNGDLLFARALGWLAWDGRRYAQDELGIPGRHAQDVAVSIRTESASARKRASKISSEERRKQANKDSDRLWAWAARSQQEKGLRCMLKVAECLPEFAVMPSAFDSDLMLLNALNGTIDLRTGRLRDSAKGDRITKLAPVELRSDWGCPTWLAFLGRIFDGREDLIDFVQRCVGYSLTGDTGEQCFFLLHGTGANGKSTLLEVLRHVLGDYAMNTSADALMVSGRGGRGPENDIARLRGARLVTASESGERRRLDEERVKRLTGGDTYTARFLHREFFEFRPRFKLWLAANSKPEIQGTDHGMWRRVHLLPFEVRIPDAEKDPKMPQKLIAEAPGILQWAVDGCLAWQRQGLDPPLAVTDATAEYRRDEDVLARFVEDECVVLEQVQVTTGALYSRYVDWCREQGESPCSSKALNGRMRNDGRFTYGRSKSGRFWCGIGLRAKQDDGDRSGDR